MRALCPALVVPLALVVANPLAAQATRDQARLVFNVGLGYIGGGDLWRVTGQPLVDDASFPIVTDSLTLSRRVGSSLTFGVKGIYFPGDHLGFMGEAYFLGLGMADNCTRTFAEPPASTRNNQICASIDGSELPASAVQVAGGLIYRVNSRKTVSPYARGAVGLILSSQSSVAVSGTFNNADNRPVLKEIYPGESSTRIDVSSTLAFGLTAALGPGYQVRWEVRDNIVSLREPTGASLQDGIAPPTARRFHHLFGFEVGFDVVLERRRGRRY